MPRTAQDIASDAPAQVAVMPIRDVFAGMPAAAITDVCPMAGGITPRQEATLPVRLR